MKVLLIEDDPLIAQAVKSSLIDDAYVVETATNGTDALSLIALQEYGFILLDLGLPGIDGITVLKTLRGSPKKETPVIIMTARDGLNDRLEGLDAGADDYLVKPFHMSELLARMRAVLRRKAQSVVNTLSNGVVTLNIQEKTAKIVDSDETVAL